MLHATIYVFFFRNKFCVRIPDVICGMHYAPYIIINVFKKSHCWSLLFCLKIHPIQIYMQNIALLYVGMICVFNTILSDKITKIGEIIRTRRACVKPIRKIRLFLIILLPFNPRMFVLSYCTRPRSLRMAENTIPSTHNTIFHSQNHEYNRRFSPSASYISGHTPYDSHRWFISERHVFRQSPDRHYINTCRYCTKCVFEKTTRWKLVTIMAVYSTHARGRMLFE